MGEEVGGARKGTRPLGKIKCGDGWKYLLQLFCESLSPAPWGPSCSCFACPPACPATIHAIHRPTTHTVSFPPPCSRRLCPPTAAGAVGRHGPAGGTIYTGRRKYAARPLIPPARGGLAHPSHALPTLPWSPYAPEGPRGVARLAPGASSWAHPLCPPRPLLFYADATAPPKNATRPPPPPPARNHKPLHFTCKPSSRRATDTRPSFFVGGRPLGASHVPPPLPAGGGGGWGGIRAAALVVPAPGTGGCGHHHSPLPPIYAAPALTSVLCVSPGGPLCKQIDFQSTHRRHPPHPNSNTNSNSKQQ